MFNNFEWLHALSWNGFKKLLALVFITVVFYFCFPPKSLFSQIQFSSWHSDFYFILYWFFACASTIGFLGLIVVLGETPFAFKWSSYKAIFALLTEEEKNFITNAKNNNDFIRANLNNHSCDVLSELRIIKK